jgi:hypothetical protein
MKRAALAIVFAALGVACGNPVGPGDVPCAPGYRGQLGSHKVDAGTRFPVVRTCVRG